MFAQRQHRIQSCHLVSSGKPDQAVPRSVHADNPILTQQRILGNQAMQRFAQSCPLGLPNPGVCPLGGACHSCPVQAKLTVNQPGGKYEQEADRVAEQVMRMSDQEVPVSERIHPLRIQRECSECDEELQRQPLEEEEEEEELVQAKEASGQTPEVTPNVKARIDAMRGGGQPLPEPARSFFESRFGYDFSQVQVHTDTQAAQTARAVNARAITVGQNVMFGVGQYAPESAKGKRLLAHELTHVVQQNRTINRIQTQLFDPADIMSEDPLHAAIIRDYRRRHGLRRDEGPSDADIKYRLIPEELGIYTPQLPSRRQGSSGQPSSKEGRPRATSSCPTFVSLTARGIDPTLNTGGRRGRCRFSLGSCRTPRGTCGRSTTSGMVFTATVDAGAGCTGELGFMQNVLSTDRRTVLANGTSECLSTNARHHDGGPPWKGCKVSVTAPGRATIVSDDCPDRALDGFTRQPQYNNPRSVSITDTFKMYLLWKVSGSRHWRPIANVTWGWSGSITLASGATGATPCTSRYTINSRSHTDGTGTASTERPVSRPSIGSLRSGPCP